MHLNKRLLKLWQTFGYYSRARNLHAAAKMIVADYQGVFPKSFENIKSLKGIGDYTAAAIASFAYNLPHAVVDGNVYRVLARLFAIPTPIDSSEGKKDFAILAQKLLDKKILPFIIRLLWNLEPWFANLSGPIVKIAP